MTAVIAMAAAIAGALFCVCVAGIKNRDLASWFLLGAAVPLVSAVAICVLPRLDFDGMPMR